MVTAQQLEMTGATDINQRCATSRLLQLWLGKPLGLVFGAARFHPHGLCGRAAGAQDPEPASWRVEPYTIDSITVLRGPTSVLYGQGDPGAIVDVQSKLANGDRIREIEVQVGNYARKQLAFDIGDTANSDGTLSYRLIGVGRDGNSQTGPNKDGRIAFTPSLRWQPSAATSLTLSATYRRPQRHRQQLPAGPGHGAAQSQRPHLARCVHRRAGLQLLPQEAVVAGLCLRAQARLDRTLRQNVRLMHSQLNNRSVWGGGLDASDRTMASISRYAGIFQFNYSRFDIDNQAEAKFRTGGLQHTLLAGSNTTASPPPTAKCWRRRRL